MFSIYKMEQFKDAVTFFFVYIFYTAEFLNFMLAVLYLVLNYLNHNPVSDDLNKLSG